MNFKLLGRQALAGALIAGLGCAGFSAPAAAFVSEVRGGIYAHDPFSTTREGDHADINAEIVFETPSFLSWAFNPRPRLGGTLSGNGGTSLVYLDVFGWTIDLTDNLFIDAAVGGALHDGNLKGSAPNERYFGCRANFHQSASLGYRITPQLSVMASVEHMSNASLCDHNDGLTNAGVRLGYSF